ncbi:MAG: restriction endonuclease subunit S [Comamonadaceae bacterium]|nr:restriction endonuclease subunit S [Comamonadaceae bacterium]
MSWSASAFPMKPLGELARIQAGYAFESARFTEAPEDVPLVKGENVQQGYVDWSIAKRWPEAEMDALEQFLLKPGDIVVAMDRPWVEAGLKWAYIKPEDPPSLLVQRVARLRAGPELEQTYLRAVISSSCFSAYIQPIVTGVNVPHISGKQIAGFKVPVPPLEQQRKVAALISAYDDLIANNQRRIALLESMAEEIYREWFVRMRFPGADRASFAKGLPLGWERKNLREVAEVDPLERRRTGEPAPFVPMDRLSTQSMCFDADEIRSDWAGAKFRNHDVLLPRITPSLENGKRGYVLCLKDDEVGVGSTEFIVLRATQISPEHLYFLSISDGFRKHAELSMSGASGRQRVQEDCFNFFLVAVPPPDVTEAFVQVVRPMFKQVFNLAEQNKRLAAQRDALLPRLISGKLRVEALDIQFPPSMQPPPAEAAQREAIAS